MSITARDHAQAIKTCGGGPLEYMDTDAVAYQLTPLFLQKYKSEDSAVAGAINKVLESLTQSNIKPTQDDLNNPIIQAMIMRAANAELEWEER